MVMNLHSSTHTSWLNGIIVTELGIQVVCESMMFWNNLLNPPYNGSRLTLPWMTRMSLKCSFRVRSSSSA